MTGALVNGRMVSYSHLLQGGDVVKILTSNSAKGPSRDWLNIIRSPEARNKIRQWFKKEKRDENIVHGKQALEAGLRHANFSMSDAMEDAVLHKLLSPTAFQTIEDLYAAIGYGGVSSQKIVNRIRDILRQLAAEQAKEQKELFHTEQKVQSKVKPVQGVIVEGLDNCLIKFARCCSPVPGDAIIGFITRGHGVSVHRQDCINYIQQEKLPESQGRWISSSWGDTESRTYSTAINVSMRSRAGLVVEVASIFNTMGIDLNSLNAKETGNETAFVAVVISVKSRDELISAMARLMSIRGVTEVKRVGA
jgi:GTP pyrophosphokinase